ncbi:hypothetical protein N0V83_007345 [Neocucurbitaria cava]|uniref:Uncharacterized protein n=1 Tax=Neocucurbitaria cava TaxID=798079 RepID=A0A9W8Y478_9PLEO|nr:hypothetical protein N0V83_007345 [Neocucurbitaria cava]
MRGTGTVVDCKKSIAQSSDDLGDVLLRLRGGAPRNHVGIFVEVNEDLSGSLFQVTGSIQNGMTFGHKKAYRPEDSASYVSKTYVGTIAKDDYARIQAIVEAIPPPPKQFNGPRRIDPSKPLITCQEWTKEAVQALKDGGVLKE